MTHFRKISSNDVNGITEMELATIFAPIFFGEDRQDSDGTFHVDENHNQVRCMMAMISINFWKNQLELTGGQHNS